MSNGLTAGEVKQMFEASDLATANRVAREIAHNHAHTGDKDMSANGNIVVQMHPIHKKYLEENKCGECGSYPSQINRVLNTEAGNACLKCLVRYYEAAKLPNDLPEAS